ncbi:HAD-IIA family hydrolase [Paenibacillus beijingensis]|uniref:Haloacid dehalogenase n=1 Tax=Paenibacillus beijingensis TaxID=1126833 RepID=A0A0D5NHM9_9BACL|nr:HAD-IIA family hydrolase [Paenibacillus beijingensis]AJY74771.1 hypothetical protein VN24_09455 [Paenibacillus beijingensis]
MDYEERLSNIKVCFFDLDGCVYHGSRLSPGVIPLLAELRQRAIRFAFLTNNSRLRAPDIGARLAAMGLNVAARSIVSVTDIAGAYIRDKFGRVTVKTIGSDGLARSIEEAGHTAVAWDGPSPDVVIVGRDTEFHYGKLQQIAADIGRGARLIAANPDRYHPGASGERIPETGALLAAIEAITGGTAECIGKPEPYIFEHGMKLFGAAPEHCVMVGDNPDTDIAGSIRAGLKSVWITNETADGHPDSMPEWSPDWPRPDIALSSIEQFYRLVASGVLQSAN